MDDNTRSSLNQVVSIFGTAGMSLNDPNIKKTARKDFAEYIMYEFFHYNSIGPIMAEDTEKRDFTIDSCSCIMQYASYGGSLRTEGRKLFNLGIGELVLVLLVAFVIVGPKDLPKVARWLARQVKKARRIIRELKEETGWDDLTREFRDTADDLKSVAKEADITSDLKDTLSEAGQGIQDISRSVQSAGDDLRRSLQPKETKD